ncbi:MAG: phosphoglycerate dehydrogenase [Ignavibacteria bacterium]|nr:MAG: phosphoglycerate dehydrogenase [Ignavibacteria bacterium]
MKKLLIADKLPEKFIEEFKGLGLDVSFEPGLGENDLVEAAKDAEILVVRSTKVNAETINNSEKLSLIIRAGAGYNNINLDAANKKGVYVANCPGKNAIAVAELAIGLLIALDRKIPDNVIDFRNGKWNKATYSKAEGLFGKSIAVIGMGNIGREVAKRAKALGMTVYGKTHRRKVEDVDFIEISDLKEVLPKVDAVSLHLPQTEETKNLFNKEMFSLMKDGAIFINTARAGVVDEEALIEAVQTKGIKAGLDVFSEEPEYKKGDVNSKFRDIDGVYVTHHIGASTQQAQDAVAAEVVRIVKGYVESGKVDNWVNRGKDSSDKVKIVVKHFDKPGVLASVLADIRDENVNVEEVENIIFDGGFVASCTMALERMVSDATLNKIKNNPDVITVIV